MYRSTSCTSCDHRWIGRTAGTQVHRTLLSLSFKQTIRCIAIYGGAPHQNQSKKLGKGCDILVATPGRLRAFMKDNISALGSSRKLSLEKLQFVVYDEADELMSAITDGSAEQQEPRLKSKTFQEEVNKIEALLPTGKPICHWFFSS